MKHTFLMLIQFVRKVKPLYDNYLEDDPIESVFQRDVSLLMMNQQVWTKDQ